ncbi:exodeoxyribonuclease VII small subunit [Aquiflexum sp.]|uniref:exodeoxyribonuclease VII small subunit n=1 Tax=Aquiflexum sp. TaxID=1872584 RepID=UPI003593C41E
MENKIISYDKAVARIEEIVNLLESGEKGMDELSELVQEATKLVKFCKNKLRTTESEISKALEDNEENQ